MIFCCYTLLSSLVNIHVGRTYTSTLLYLHKHAGINTYIYTWSSSWLGLSYTESRHRPPSGGGLCKQQNLASDLKNRTSCQDGEGIHHAPHVRVLVGGRDLRVPPQVPQPAQQSCPGLRHHQPACRPRIRCPGLPAAAQEDKQ